MFDPGLDPGIEKLAGRIDGVEVEVAQTVRRQQPGRSLIRAFEEPSASNRQRALTAVEEALEQPQLSPRSTRYLHFIRAALLDEQSSLARSEG